MVIVIRGAGDLATGIALRLYRSGYHLVMTDLPEPTAIRRTVCFSEAIRQGEMEVEGVRAVSCADAQDARRQAEQGAVAVLGDPAGTCIPVLKPGAVVDAILAKRNLGTSITDAPVVIGVGPGFTAGVDCHAAVETKRGHTLGRALYTGSPLPNTGVPGIIGGRRRTERSSPVWRSDGWSKPGRWPPQWGEFPCCAPSTAACGEFCRKELRFMPG